MIFNFIPTAWDMCKSCPLFVVLFSFVLIKIFKQCTRFYLSTNICSPHFKILKHHPFENMIKGLRSRVCTVGLIVNHELDVLNIA